MGFAAKKLLCLHRLFSIDYYLFLTLLRNISPPGKYLRTASFLFIAFIHSPLSCPWHLLDSFYQIHVQILPSVIFLNHHQ